jgi:hypothetical protein
MTFFPDERSRRIELVVELARILALANEKAPG